MQEAMTFFKNIALWLLLLLLFFIPGLLLLGWYEEHSGDQPLNPAYAKFFRPDPFRPDNNFFVALAGLQAPAGEKNLRAYGLKVIRREIDSRGENTLHFAGKPDHLCLSQQDFREKRTCASPAGLGRLAADNKELLARYKNFYRQTGLRVSAGDQFSLPGTSFTDVMELHRLLAASWIADSGVGRGREAMREWLASTAFIKHVLRGKMSLVGHAIWMTLYGINLKSLPVMMEKDPSRFLVSVFEVELRSIAFPNDVVFARS